MWRRHAASVAVALVRSSEQPLAIFDLDRTLLPGSSLVHVARA
jgi:hypothetical protein